MCIRDRGTWYYTAGCVNDPFAQVRAFCATATIDNVMGTGRGCVTFAPTVVNRRVAVSVTGNVTIPPSCLMGVLTCAQIQTTIAASFPGAMCSAAGGGCSCTLTASSNINDNQSPYAYTAGVLTVGAGTYNTCVSPAGTLKYTRTGGQSLEDGQFTLTQQ